MHNISKFQKKKLIKKAHNVLTKVEKILNDIASDLNKIKEKHLDENTKEKT